MAKVLIASWNWLGDGEDISVTVRNLTGDELCSFWMQNATVGDLELRLLDPKGPLQDHFRSPLLKFYTRNETSKELDMHLQISKLDEELYIHESAVGIWLEKWPDTGKFLEAMRYNKFDPRSPNFEISWKARTVPEVSPRKALGLVREVLHGPPSNAETECRFVKVFGKLTAGMESWDKFDLALLQNFDPGLKHFKHLVCQHYVDLARFVATTLVSTDQPLPPIMAFFKIGCNVAGHDWPWPFNGNQGVQNSLRFSDVSPSFRWSFISRALRFWEWDYLQKGLQGFKVNSEVDRQEPEDFPKLHPDEVLQMLHVQLRLSSCNVAEVQGRLSEACVRILAKLLGYELKILKYENPCDFDATIQGFDQEVEQQVETEPQKFLVLVTNLPATCRGSFFAGHHRMILCYNTDGDSQ